MFNGNRVLHILLLLNLNGGDEAPSRWKQGAALGDFGHVSAEILPKKPSKLVR